MHLSSVDFLSFSANDIYCSASSHEPQVILRRKRKYRVKNTYEKRRQQPTFGKREECRQVTRK